MHLNRFWVWGMFGGAMASLLACSPAQAQYRPAVIDVNEEFGIAAQGFLQSYSETLAGHTFDSEHGTIPGFQAKASTMFDALGVDNLYAGLNYQFDQGGVGYASSYTVFDTPRSTPLKTTTHYSVNDLSGEFGKGFLLTQNVLVTPFVQGGWRNWRRELSSVQVEDYSNFYAGAGVRGDLGVTDRLVLTGRLGIAETIDPTMTATTAQLIPPGTTFKLGTAPLYQAGIGVDYRLFALLHLYSGVDYTHLSYGRSAVDQYGYLEPSSATDEVVFRLGIAVAIPPIPPM